MTVRTPLGVCSWTVPPATGNISNVTSVPAIFSVYGRSSTFCAAIAPALIADIAPIASILRGRLRIAGLLFALSAAGCAAPLERFEFRERQMGTEARIVLYAPSRERAEDAAKAAFARIAALDAALSDYRNGSELVTVLLKGAQVPVPLSDDLFTVLRASLALSEETKGAFDVTVGMLTSARRVRYATIGRGVGAIAVSRACDVVRGITWRSITLDTVARTVVFKHPDMRLDLGGIAKGYAADEVLEVLHEHNLDRALVSIGGDLVANR